MVREGRVLWRFQVAGGRHKRRTVKVASDRDGCRVFRTGAQRPAPLGNKLELNLLEYSKIM